MHIIPIDLLAKVSGGAGPQNKCPSNGPNGVTSKDPKSTWQNAPAILPTIGGPATTHPTVPCRKDEKVNAPSLSNPGATPGTSINPHPGVQSA
ncbi:MAG TPA: hypothetical protein VFQ53_36920 [Kofleriaceae bacterium]|nr:hypothetical protein [Kofleriaceae bacterium]